MSTSQHGAPQIPLPFMNTAGFGIGSQAGSEYGGQYPYQGSQPTALLPGYTNSMYGVGGGPMGPRNTVMTNLNMFSSGQSIQGGPDGNPGFSPFGVQRPMSSFTALGAAANPFASGPSQNADPSNDELLTVLRTYLGTQDLMTVTKK